MVAGAGSSDRGIGGTDRGSDRGNMANAGGEGGAGSSDRDRDKAYSGQSVSVRGPPTSLFLSAVRRAVAMLQRALEVYSSAPGSDEGKRYILS